MSLDRAMAAASKGATLDLPVTNENLRREVRFGARIPVAIHRGRTHVVAETSDVSFRGLFLKTPEALPLRSLVRLRVTLAPTRVIEVHAMVVHVVDGGGVGFQFWGLSGKDRQAWDEFVRRLVPPPKPKPKTHGADLDTPTGVRVRVPVDGSAGAGADAGIGRKGGKAVGSQ